MLRRLHEDAELREELEAQAHGGEQLQVVVAPRLGPGELGLEEDVGVGARQVPGRLAEDLAGEREGARGEHVDVVDGPRGGGAVERGGVDHAVAKANLLLE